MKPSFVRHLVCPYEGGPLQLEITKMDGEEVVEGVLRTLSGRIYPIRKGIPRFVDSDDYVATFSRQRQYVRSHFESYRRQIDYKSQAELFVQSTGFDLSTVDGLTLDAGCGYGRFLSILAQAGGETVGVDLSTDSVELAYELTGRAKNVHVVQADLTRLPFQERSFCRMFSIGVLHHTPDTGVSFSKLVPYLEEGGAIAIWVYAPERKISSNRWRKLTTRLPMGLVYGWCIVNEVLFAVLRSLPYAGARFSLLIPGGRIGAPFWSRVMGDFDDLTPRYAHTHSSAEVVEWFRDAGLVDIKVLPRATSVRGRKPLAGNQQKP